MQKIVPILIATALVVVGGIGMSRPSPDLDSGTVDRAVQQQPNLSFTRQPSDGRTVTAARVTVSAGGFVAIHDSSVEGREGDPVGSVIGVSRYLPAGTHENVTITLSQPVNATEQSSRVIARLYRDTNANRVFDFVTANGTVDGPYDSRGNPITDPATLDLSDEPLPPRASLDLRNQTAGDTVLVRDVTLSAGGFVALVDEEGAIVGVSRYLEAQTYDRVRTSVVDRPDGESTLTARAHRDTDGDRVFGFEISDERADQAYRAGRVTDNASVRFTGDGASPTPEFSPSPTPGFSPGPTPTPGFSPSPTPRFSPSPAPTA